MSTTLIHIFILHCSRLKWLGASQEPAAFSGAAGGRCHWARCHLAKTPNCWCRLGCSRWMRSWAEVWRSVQRCCFKRTPTRCTHGRCSSCFSLKVSPVATVCPLSLPTSLPAQAQKRPWSYIISIASTPGHSPINRAPRAFQRVDSLLKLADARSSRPRKGSTTTTSAAPAGTAARPLAATVGQAGPAASATTSQPPKAGGSESLSIAWRYRNVNQVSTEIGTSGGLGRDFDVSKSVPPENIAAANVLTVDVRTVSREADGVDATLDSPSALLPPHAAVLAEVTAWLAPFAVQRPTAPSEQRTVARVVVESLGSPLWSADGEELVSTIRLLHRLRALARQAFAVLLVTVPGEIVAPDPLRRCVHLSDAAVGLEAFAGTPNEHSPLLKEYHGFVHVLKLPRLNTLTPYYPDTLDLAFKLRRKKFVIERIHLPPDLSETVSRTQGAAPKHAAAAAAGGAAAAATDW
eukprot:m.201599 g.201599  ORF g.201599 m.201599 type:complete len:464 (+) comp15347_c0_seq3:226-1617(+)